jgi:NADPH:quinone reductase-like Zn-dependent oxidoreductase
MTPKLPESGLQIFSTVTEAGRIELSLRPVPVPQPADDEVIIRVDATPINPSDLGLLLSVADITQLTTEGGITSAPIPPHLQRVVAARRGAALPIGNEGAGTVIAAGASAAAQALLGKIVSLAGGQMYAQYRCAKAQDCLELPTGVSAEAGASSFVNPMTALGMIGTMRKQGFTGLIHTAAASNLGQMLVKLTQAEAIPLVNIVRSDAQAALLRGIGATHVIDSSAENFPAALAQAIEQTGAYLAFDAIGGGRLAQQILQAMETAAGRGKPYSVYGTTQKKQVYIYGSLNTGPTEITRSFGFSWNVGGWLLTPYLQEAGGAEIARMRQFIRDHLHDIFASHYTAQIALHDVLDPAIIAKFAQRATGAKYLINPTR